MDGAEWCLRDFIRRAETCGYHTCVTAQPELLCTPEIVFGSAERRRKQTLLSRERYLSRWGLARHYCLYFGPNTDASGLSETVGSLVTAARQGHRFTLLLHRRQFNEFRRRGWNGLHTAIVVCKLPFFATQRNITRRFAALQAADPDLIPVRVTEDVPFPGVAAPICLTDVVSASENGISPPAQWGNVMEAI